MKYAMLIYIDPHSWDGLSEDEAADITRQYMDIRQDPRCLGGEQLQGLESATTVRVAGGQALTTDGPFAATREVFGGFYLFKAGDLDEALDVAARIPATWMNGSVEVRPVVERPAVVES
jgi:hypothetical protein